MNKSKYATRYCLSKKLITPFNRTIANGNYILGVQLQIILNGCMLFSFFLWKFTSGLQTLPTKPRVQCLQTLLGFSVCQ